MNALDRARMAYSTPGTATRTLRGIEYDAFARVTHRMKAASTAAGPNFATLVRALHDNRELWSVMSDDVADDANGLPRKLRAQIFTLAAFTQQHTQKVLAGEAKVEVLIDINTAIMRGLRQDGGEK